MAAGFVSVARAEENVKTTSQSPSATQLASSAFSSTYCDPLPTTKRIPHVNAAEHARFMERMRNATPEQLRESLV